MNRKIPVPFLGGWRALLPSSYPTHLWGYGPFVAHRRRTGCRPLEALRSSNGSRPGDRDQAARQHHLKLAFAQIVAQCVAFGSHGIQHL
jgi:hypothetical protein